MRQGKAVVAGGRSIGCGHCAAVCPVAAVTVGGIDPETSRYATFEADSRWLPHGECDVAQLVRLMASRRSCRNFKDAPVGRDLLEDLVRIGATAPSGTNIQGWSFTILPDRQAVHALGDRIARFFERLNRLAGNRWLREGLKLLGKPELSAYYHDYYQPVSEALAARAKGGRDRLFHGATAVIIVASRPGGSTPSEDALLAAQNMLLAAHAMGLGSCLIGLAVAPMARDARIGRAVGLPDGERVHAVIALGYPDERYLKAAGRKPIIRRYYEG